MATIFSRLNYNFDSSKFGDALDPKGDLTLELNKIPSLMTKWQYDAVANNDVSVGYFKNPVANISNTLWANSNSILSLSTVNFENAIGSQAADLLSNVTTLSINTAPYFLGHTNRLSGVNVSTNATESDLNSALGVGEVILLITNRYDGIQNNIPILGNFTSLFISDEITSNTANLNSNLTLLQNSIRTELIDLVPTLVSNLTSGQINTLINGIKSANTCLHNSYSSDLLFYNTSKQIIEDYSKISSFSKFSPLKLYLIENYIGTDKLKSKL